MICFIFQDSRAQALWEFNIGEIIDFQMSLTDIIVLLLVDVSFAVARSCYKDLTKTGSHEENGL